MDDRTARLESIVEQLQSTVLTLQQRIDALEVKGFGAAPLATAAAASGPAQAGADAGPSSARAKDPYDPIAILSLAGRLLLVLAGGFFLRALTDAGTLAVPVGIALAFAYAAVWLFMTDRAGGRAQVPSAVCHALAAAMVAFPLVVEATTRFKVLSGLAGAFVISAVTAGLLFVAWHRRLRAVAWITVVGALPTCAVLLAQTGIVVPFAIYLIALGVATLWLGYSVGWWGLRWPVALAADIAVAGVTLRALTPEQHDTPLVAMLLQLLLVVGYVSSIAIRTLVRRRNVVPFEIVQTTAALVVSLGGALYMAETTSAVPALLGVATLLVGMACYGVAAAFVKIPETGARNFYFYTTLALALVLTGVTIALDSMSTGAVFALLAVLATGLWMRRGRLFMLLHGAVYLVAAGFASGALGYAARTLVTGVHGSWALPDAVMLVVLVASTLSAGFTAARTIPRGDEIAIGTRFIITLVFVWTSGGILTGYLAPVAGALADRSIDPGVLATVRTGVLSVATLVIAWMGGQVRFREWGWLVYPLLVGIGLKLMTQDFKHSRPATLFIAMALYGAALIIAPRLRRRGQQAAAAG